MSPVEWTVLPLIGAAGGFLAGMLGVGGGIIFIPVLTYLFEKQGLSNTEIVKYTLANSIFLVFISGLSGIVGQYRKNLLDWKKMFLIGIPGTTVSIVWSFLIQQGHWYKKESFQMVFLLFLIFSIANMIFGRSDRPNKGAIENGKNKTGVQILVAMLAGSVVALSGLGGGVIMVPMFRMILKMPMRSATALSLSIIPLLSIAPLVSYLVSPVHEHVNQAHTGYLVWPYALPIAAAVAIFASLGLKTARRIPVLALRLIFATLSVAVFIKTIYDITNK